MKLACCDRKGAIKTFSSINRNLVIGWCELCGALHLLYHDHIGDEILIPMDNQSKEVGGADE